MGAERFKELEYLKRTTRQARKYLTGFDASDGYDLRHPERWPAKRVETLKRYGGYINELTGQKHIRVRAPKSKAKRAALESFTGQRLRGSKQFRAFAIADQHADKALVRITENNQVEIEHTFKGVRSVERIFLFDDYGYDPGEFSSIDDVKRATRLMLKRRVDGAPLMPDGNYQFFTEKHGPIWEAIPRDSILLNLTAWGNTYGHVRGAESVIIGFKLLRDDVSIERVADEREARRMATVERRRARQTEMKKLLRKWRKSPKKPKRKK